MREHRLGTATEDPISLDGRLSAIREKWIGELEQIPVEELSKRYELLNCLDAINRIIGGR